MGFLHYGCNLRPHIDKCGMDGLNERKMELKERGGLKK
jgi:hypothetical protein